MATQLVHRRLTPCSTFSAVRLRVRITKNLAPAGNARRRCRAFSDVQTSRFLSRHFILTPSVYVQLCVRMLELTRQGIHAGLNRLASEAVDAVVRSIA